MRRPRLLDLCCGQGGASVGYYLAGFDVIGVDTHKQPQYPFPFIRRDALSVLDDDDLLDEFDAIHASPPCHSESTLRHSNSRDYTDFLTPTLAALDDLIDVPWVVENVEFTRKMPGSAMLCGTHFNLGAAGRILRRHRRFLTSFPLPPTGPCWCAGKLTGGIYGNLRTSGNSDPAKFSFAEARVAMGIDWMSMRGLVLSIPPDYTRWVGEHLMAHLRAQAPARDYLRERYTAGRIERLVAR